MLWVMALHLMHLGETGELERINPPHYNTPGWGPEMVVSPEEEGHK